MKPLSSKRKISRILRRKEVEAITGLGRSSIYRLMRKGFPKQINLGGRSVGWSQEEIMEWMQSRIDKRN